MTTHPVGATVRVRDGVSSRHAGKTGVVDHRIEAIPGDPRTVLVRFGDATALYTDADLEGVTAPPKREPMLHDVDRANPNPARAWHAGEPPVCPECGCDASYAKWEQRDYAKALHRQNAALRERVARLRAWGEYWHGCADAFYYERDGDAPKLQHGDLVGGEGDQ